MLLVINNECSKTEQLILECANVFTLRVQKNCTYRYAMMLMQKVSFAELFLISIRNFMNFLQFKRWEGRKLRQDNLLI